MLKPELDHLSNGPRSATEMLDRLTNPNTGTQPESQLAMPGELLSVKQAAKRLGVCSKSVQNWARLGRIPRIKVGRVVRIPMAGIVGMMENRRPMN
jgi:excisionase family DNA binding protein